MGKSRSRRQSGGFVMVLHSMMKGAAWKALSGNAVKLLMHLMMLSEGNNGWGHKGEEGELYLSERTAADALGVSRNTASRAFQELIDHGFLRVVRQGHFKVKLKVATAWRLTFQPYPKAQQGPTNEWREWRPEQISREQKLDGTGAKIGHSSEIPGSTGAKSDPAKMENGGKQPTRTGSIIAPHIDLPRDLGASERDPASVWWAADAAMRAALNRQLALLAWLATPQMRVAA